MVYITGDTHGEFDRFDKRSLKYHNLEFSDKDYVIVCGDFGLCWAKDKTFEYNCQFFEECKFTTLWVQGNHSNYDMIKEYPLEEWRGGKVRHIVRNKVLLLERGQIFILEGKKYFTFGGARSHDVDGGILDREDPEFQDDRRRAIECGLPFRILHESWWKEELPDKEELEEGRRNLQKVDYEVDYIITHCCSSMVQKELEQIFGYSLENDILTDYLDELENGLKYKQWYFGHYHENLNLDQKHTLLYTAMIQAGDMGKDLEHIPIPGRPFFHYQDPVSIPWKGETKEGVICGIDAYGTFGQKEEPSYDVYISKENCLYKHIRESEILNLYDS